MLFLFIASVAAAVYWSVALYRVALTLVMLPTGRSGVKLADGELAEAATRSIAVFVPAHNEEDTIGDLIASLRSQDHPAMRVVLALDRCTDRTRQLAIDSIGGDERFEIAEINDCPDGWAGKVHALHGAMKQAPPADDELLLFTDADCTFEPPALRAAAALLAERGLHLLSFLNVLRSRRWFERIVQPMAGFELVRQYPLLRVNKGGQDRRAFANGQFMLFDPDAYRRIGGHEHHRVRSALLEDIALAKRVDKEGLRGGLLPSGGLVRCAMYDDWRDFRRGWKRIFTEAANRRSSRLRENGVRIAITCCALPLLAIAALIISLAGSGKVDLPLLIAGGYAVAVWLLSLVLIYRVSRAPAWSVLFAPVAALLVGRILLSAGRDLRGGRPTRWAGREYAPEDRGQRRPARQRRKSAA